jgi:predicted acylesterase/phospholipase RssA
VSTASPTWLRIHALVRRAASIVSALAAGLALVCIVGIVRFDDHHRLRDVGLALAPLVTVAALHVRLRTRLSKSRAAAVGLLAAWVFLSLFVGRGPALRRDGRRLGPAPVRPHVAVALSGGGYRAAILHAGVLAALDRAGVEITIISAVSGGAIIGAFYATGGKPETFVQALRDNRLKTKRDVFTIHNVIRLAFPFTIPTTDIQLFPWYAWDRLDLQAEMLDRALFSGRGASTSFPPRLILGTSDLRTAALVGITSAGFLLQDAPKVKEIMPDFAFAEAAEGAFPKRPGSLAEAVAISGAFPGAFPPRIVATMARMREGLPGEINGVPLKRRMERLDLTLADGGIVDNTGVGLLMLADALAVHGVIDDESRIDVIVASDAGQALAPSSTHLSEVGSVVRAMDIIHSIPQVPSMRLGARGPTVFSVSAREGLWPEGIVRRSWRDPTPREQVRQFFCVGLHGIGLANLELLVEFSSPGRRLAVEAAVRGLRANAATSAKALPGFHCVDGLASIERWRGAANKSGTPTLPESILLYAIEADVAEGLLAFQHISTLDDDISPDLIDAVYRLGAILMTLHVGALQEVVTSAP